MLVSAIEVRLTVEHAAVSTTTLPAILCHSFLHAVTNGNKTAPEMLPVT
jgi:hypothetical protein